VLGLEEAGRLAPGSAEQAEMEIQRFALAHEMATRPAEALPLVESLLDDHAVPELEYLRGVLLHRMGDHHHPMHPMPTPGGVSQAGRPRQSTPIPSGDVLG
jgi:hypothetical protein